MSRIRTPQGPSPKDEVVNCPAHLKWIEGLPCLIRTGGHFGRIDAHHEKRGSQRGMGGDKPDDEAVPLCRRHHDQRHTKGPWWFRAKHGIDLRAVAKTLWRDSPAGVKYRNLEGMG